MASIHIRTNEFDEKVDNGVQRRCRKKRSVEELTTVQQEVFKKKKVPDARVKDDSTSPSTIATLNNNTRHDDGDGDGTPRFPADSNAIAEDSTGSKNAIAESHAHSKPDVTIVCTITTTVSQLSSSTVTHNYVDTSNGKLFTNRYTDANDKRNSDSAVDARRRENTATTNSTTGVDDEAVKVNFEGKIKDSSPTRPSLNEQIGNESITTPHQLDRVLNIFEESTRITGCTNSDNVAITSKDFSSASSLKPIKTHSTTASENQMVDDVTNNLLELIVDKDDESTGGNFKAQGGTIGDDPCSGTINPKITQHHPHQLSQIEEKEIGISCNKVADASSEKKNNVSIEQALIKEKQVNDADAKSEAMIGNKGEKSKDQAIKTYDNDGDGFPCTIVNPGLIQHQPNEEEAIVNIDKEIDANVSDENDEDQPQIEQAPTKEKQVDDAYAKSAAMIVKEEKSKDQAIKTYDNDGDGSSCTIVNLGLIQHQPNEEEAVVNIDEEIDANVSDENDEDQPQIEQASTKEKQTADTKSAAMIVNKEEESKDQAIKTHGNDGDGSSCTIVNLGLIQHQPNEEEAIVSINKEIDANVSDENDEDQPQIEQASTKEKQVDDADANRDKEMNACLEDEHGKDKDLTELLSRGEEEKIGLVGANKDEKIISNNDPEYVKIGDRFDLSEDNERDNIRKKNDIGNEEIHSRNNKEDYSMKDCIALAPLENNDTSEKIFVEKIVEDRVGLLENKLHSFRSVVCTSTDGNHLKIEAKINDGADLILDANQADTVVSQVHMNIAINDVTNRSEVLVVDTSLPDQLQGKLIDIAEENGDQDNISMPHGLIQDTAMNRINYMDCLKENLPLPRQIVNKIDSADKKDCRNNNRAVLKRAQSITNKLTKAAETIDFVGPSLKHICIQTEEGSSMAASILDTCNDSLLSVFPEINLCNSRKGSMRRTSKKRKKSISISLEPGTYKKRKNSRNYVPVWTSSIPTFSTSTVEEDEHKSVDVRAMEFFSEVHEEEDISSEKYREVKPEQYRELELRKLECADTEIKVKLMALLEAKQEKLKCLFQKQAEDRRKKIMRNIEIQRGKLKEKYKVSLKLDNAKIHQGMKWISRENEKELNALKENLVKKCNARGISLPAEVEHIRQIELRKIEKRTLEQKRNVHEKGRQILKINEVRFKAQELKQDRSYNKNKVELDLAEKKFRADYQRQHEQQRNNYIRWHTDTVQNLKDDIVRRFILLDNASDKQHLSDLFSKALQTRVNCNGLSSSKEKTSETRESVERKGAALRQKGRKAVLSKPYSTRLSVEIHNEGIAICCSGRTSESDSDTAGRSGKESSVYRDPKVGGIDFIPWGVNARKFLHSIVCGEIPLHHSLNTIDTIGQDRLPGGQIKCMVTDMRVDGETAIIDRAKAFKETKNKIPKKIALENKLSEMKKRVAFEVEKEKRYDRSIKHMREQLEKAKRNLKIVQEDTQAIAVKSRTLACFNPDGSELENKNRHRITAYQGDVTHAEELLHLEMKKLSDAERKVVQVAESCKECMRLVEEMKSEIFGEEKLLQARDVIIVLNEIFEGRRLRNTNQKHSTESNNRSSPESKREILLHKMQRRRLTIVLRPSRSRIMDEVKLITKVSKGDNSLDTFMSAEQLLLLSLHPWACSRLPSAPLPTLTGEWAEPGWQVTVEIEPSENNVHPILPTIGQKCHILRLNSSEHNSAQGHQAASLLDRRHLRSLAGDSLSKLARIRRISSESHAQLSMKDDSLSSTEEEISRCYMFQVLPASVLQATKHDSLRLNSKEMSTSDDSTNKRSSKTKTSPKVAHDTCANKVKVKAANGSRSQTNGTEQILGSVGNASGDMSIQMLPSPTKAYLRSPFYAASENVSNRSKRVSESPLRDLKPTEPQSIGISRGEQFHHNTVQLQPKQQRVSPKILQHQYQPFNTSQQLNQLHFSQNPQQQTHGRLQQLQPQQYTPQQPSLENQIRTVQSLQFMPCPGQDSSHALASSPHLYQSSSSGSNLQGGQAKSNTLSNPYLSFVQNGNNDLF